MAKTFAELISDVQDTLVRPDKDALVRKAINFGLEEVAKAYGWKSLRQETTVAIPLGTSSVSVTGAEPIEARFSFGSTQAYRLELVRKEVFTSRYPNTSIMSSGYPAVGYIENNVLYFGPKTSVAGDLTITMLLKHSSLVANTDTPLIEADLAIVAWACAYCFRTMSMFDQATVWTGQAASALANAVEAEKRGLGLTRKQEALDLEVERYNGATPWLDPMIKEW